MSDTLRRQWFILRHIPRFPRKIEASRIKALMDREGDESMSMTIRSIQRELQSMSETWAIVPDEHKPIGWSWAKDAAILNIPGFYPELAISYKLAEQFLIPLLPKHTLNHLQPYFKAADRELKNQKGKAYSKWVDKVTIHPQGQLLLPPKLDIASLEVVYEALFTEKTFEADYKSRGERKPTRMEIHPHGLVVMSPMIYLVGTIWDFTDMRHMALNRLSNAIITSKPINQNKDFVLANHVKKGAFGILYQEKSIKLKVLFNKYAAEHLHETPLSKDQVITDHSEHIMQLTASVPMTEQLKWWLLGFGDNVEVLQPKKLRKEIAGIAKRVCDRYHG